MSTVEGPIEELNKRKIRQSKSRTSPIAVTVKTAVANPEGEKRKVGRPRKEPSGRKSKRYEEGSEDSYDFSSDDSENSLRNSTRNRGEVRENISTPKQASRRPHRIAAPRPKPEKIVKYYEGSETEESDENDDICKNYYRTSKFKRRKLIRYNPYNSRISSSYVSISPTKVEHIINFDAPRGLDSPGEILNSS